jgi:PIN domain nuclease of toxin-antitoxin system
VIVLDTHVWVWWVSETADLPQRVRKVIDRNADENAVCVSSISVWEVALLVKKGRLQLTMSAADWIAQCEAVAGVRFVPVDNRIGLGAVLLPGALHNDPADRMIVATTLHLKAKLVTADSKLRDYAHVETFW